MEITTTTIKIKANPLYTAIDDVDITIGEILKTLGINCYRKGYFILRRSIRMMVLDPNNSQCVTKDIYPIVAKEFNTTIGAVERSIRSCIGYINCSEETMITYIGWYAESYTNKQLISGIADIVRNSIIVK